MSQIAPRVVFTLFGIPVRDTVVVTWVIMAFWMAVAGLASRGISLRPKWWQHILEAGVQALLNLIAKLTRQPGEKFLTFLGTLFIFIATANLLGTLPGLTSPTGDINTPLALALTVFFAVHYYGIKERGVRGYLQRLAEPSIVMLPMELVGQVSRTLSLCLRLFGNIVAGGVIVAVLYLLIPLLIPIPLLAFNILIGLLQAFVFTILAAVYIGAAVGAEPKAEETQKTSSINGPAKQAPALQRQRHIPAV